MNWQQYASYDPITPINQAFPSAAAAPSSAGGFGSFLSGGGGLGFLTAANSALSGLAQANANQSAENQLAAANAVFDANFGKDLFSSNLDYFRQKEAPAWAAKFAVNDPFYRQQRTMQGLPELAGRYGRFGAFVS
jgi:hypothetical protein